MKKVLLPLLVFLATYYYLSKAFAGNDDIKAVADCMCFDHGGIYFLIRDGGRAAYACNDSSDEVYSLSMDAQLLECGKEVVVTYKRRWSSRRRP